MTVVLAGAYGNLGAEIFKALLKAGHEVVAADMMERDLGVTGNFTFKKIDVTKQIRHQAYLWYMQNTYSKKS